MMPHRLLEPPASTDDCLCYRHQAQETNRSTRDREQHPNSSTPTAPEPPCCPPYAHDIRRAPDEHAIPAFSSSWHSPKSTQRRAMMPQTSPKRVTVTAHATASLTHQKKLLRLIEMSQTDLRISLEALRSLDHCACVICTRHQKQTAAHEIASDNPPAATGRAHAPPCGSPCAHDRLRAPDGHAIPILSSLALPKSTLKRARMPQNVTRTSYCNCTRKSRISDAPKEAAVTDQNAADKSPHIPGTAGKL